MAAGRVQPDRHVDLQMTVLDELAFYLTQLAGRPDGMWASYTEVERDAWRSIVVRLFERAGVDALIAAADELRLWEPGRKGYTAAQNRLFDVLDEVREGMTVGSIVLGGDMSTPNPSPTPAPNPAPPSDPQPDK